MFTFMESIFHFFDSLWLFQYQPIYFGDHINSVLGFVRSSNEIKFFPTLLDKSDKILFPPPSNSRRDESTIFMYRHLTGKNAYFLGNAENVYLWGMGTSIASLLILFLLGKLLKNTVFYLYFKKFQLLGFCLVSILEPRISNVAFLFFLEVQASFSVNIQ